VTSGPVLRLLAKIDDGVNPVVKVLSGPFTVSNQDTDLFLIKPAIAEFVLGRYQCHCQG